jgi:predicted outer membrane protein
MKMRCALLCLCATVGCASERSEAAAREADTVGRRDSIAAVAAASMGEEHVIGLLEQTHAADSALGALGATTGTATAVKEFGRMIMREHHALRRDASQLSQALGRPSQPPPVSPDEPPSAMRDSLAAADRGAAWDLAYVQYAIAVHQSAMENTARALAATKNDATKKFIEKSVPILQKHLDKASSLSKSLPSPKAQDAAPRPKP